MSEFENQVILITGAKGGLGTSVTQAFLAAGATVAGCSRCIKGADFPDPRFAAFPADLTSAVAAIELADTVIGRFHKIDALVHVMGGFAGGKPIPETDDETWDQMMDLNVYSAFSILRAVIPPMRQARRGRIVAISSRQAAEPAPDLCAYNTSKAALVALMRTAALENEDAGITVNTILPGTMDTAANRKASPDGDMSKWVRTLDVASLAVFLVSGAGASINGAAIPVWPGL